MSNFRWLLATSGSAVFLSVAAMLYASFGGKPHLSGIDCGSCHLSGQSVRPEQASKLVAAQEALCGRCHVDAVRASHPSGVAPKVRLPAEYPPDWKGDLTCSTCHRPHGTGPGLLRGAKRGKEMCLACHDLAFFNIMKDRGASIEKSGHSHPGLALGTIELDPYSLQRLGCHGGQADSEAVSVGRNGVLRHASGSANHPIGRRYRDALRSGGFHPMERLSKKILLHDGKLGCLSCHQAYKNEHGKLVIPNRGSALCLECHDI